MTANERISLLAHATGLPADKAAHAAGLLSGLSDREYDDHCRYLRQKRESVQAARAAPVTRAPREPLEIRAQPSLVGRRAPVVTLPQDEQERARLHANVRDFLNCVNDVPVDGD